MYVAVAGMYRSGSTFAFNVVRESLASAGHVVARVTASMPEDLPEAPVDVIIKSHVLDEHCTKLIIDGAMRCVCTYRKPEDAIASSMRAFDFSLDRALIDMGHCLLWHRAVAPYSLNVAYDEIDRDPLAAIHRIQRWLLGTSRSSEAEALKQRYDKAEVKKRYDALAFAEGMTHVGFSYFDSTTLFHRRHVSSVVSVRGADVLDAEQVARIRHTLAPYVDKDGDYDPGSGGWLAIRRAMMRVRRAFGRRH